MKHTILIWSLTLLASITLVPQRNTLKGRSGLAGRGMQSNAAAEQPWPAFFTALRTAVQKRNRVALSEMMSPEFTFDCCDNMDENGNGEIRDEAFRRWDKISSTRLERLEPIAFPRGRARVG
jgi:hypothetical protein